MTKDSSPPPVKKAKVAEGLICRCCDGESYGNGDGHDDEKIVNDMIDTVWEHYRNYLESESKEAEGGEDGDRSTADIDELYELIEIVRPHLTDGPQDTDTVESSLEATDVAATWTSRRAMLPILLSVVYNHLAEAAIAEFFSQERQDRDGISSSEDHLSPPTPLVLQQRLIVHKVQQLLGRSLRSYPHNAATWSTGANFGRITQTLDLVRTREWYERAVQAATTLRKVALTALESDDTPEEVKEWIELLILNQIIGTEYVEDDDDGDDDAEDEEERPTKKIKSNDGSTTEPDAFENEFDEKQQRERDEEDEVLKGEAFLNEYNETEDDIDNEERKGDDGGQYSSSAVEATARFMCAMLWSMEGRHDRALVHLKHFPLTHRLHPNVWTVSTPSKNPPLSSPTSAPVVFQPSEGILPTNLYLAMTKLFAPDAAYWSESDYTNRGYYSFFMDHDEEGTGHGPRNLLEEVIVNHLLPRAQQVLDMEANKDIDEEGCDGNNSKEPAPKICGFEWWAHTRPIDANLGHNLHFDTDEALLDQEGKVTHPILSSVLYLTGAESQSANSVNGSVPTSSLPPSPPPAGATVVLDQTPESETVATRCWQGIPKDNSLLIFPGDRLHGVLPCPGRSNVQDDDRPQPATASNATLEELVGHWKDLEPDSSSDVTSTTSSPPNRLTFMVGFWTRIVPATMNERNLYGPCGDLPPSTDQHTWVRELTEGYDTVNDDEKRPVAPKTMPATSLPCVSPAWEQFDPNDGIATNTDDTDQEAGYADGEPPLLIPHAIDHRFFVRGAPQCFRNSLFEDKGMDC